MKMESRNIIFLVFRHFLGVVTQEKRLSLRFVAKHATRMETQQSFSDGCNLLQHTQAQADGDLGRQQPTLSLEIKKMAPRSRLE